MASVSGCFQSRSTDISGNFSLPWFVCHMHILLVLAFGKPYGLVSILHFGYSCQELLREFRQQPLPAVATRTCDLVDRHERPSV